MDVLSVGKASVRVQPSLNTRELTLEKNLINVFNVGKDLDKVHTLSDTKEYIKIKSHHFDMLLHDLFCLIVQNYILWRLEYFSQSWIIFPQVSHTR